MDACIFQPVMTHIQTPVWQLLHVLQANSQMETEMLEQQLRAARKEVTSLKCRLEAATAALASANISSANPALLRIMKAEGKGGPHRGAGGTPHALALAWAREEAARLSPALAMVGPDLEPPVCHWHCHARYLTWPLLIVNGSAKCTHKNSV